MTKSIAEEEFALLLRAEYPQIPKPKRGYKFHPNRRWEFDFAYPDWGVAVEIEGGGYTRGGHARMGEAWKDCERFNRALLMGWIVLRIPTTHHTSDEAVAFLIEALRSRGWS